MNFEKPTEEMKELLYKNYKWSVRGELFFYGIIATPLTGVFIIGLLFCKELSVIQIIITGITVVIFLSTLVSYKSTLKKMKSGDFMISKVIFKGFHKKLHSPLEMEFEYENAEGSRITERHQVDVFKGKRPPVAGEEIVITMMPNQTIYFVE